MPAPLNNPKSQKVSIICDKDKPATAYSAPLPAIKTIRAQYQLLKEQKIKIIRPLINQVRFLMGYFPKFFLSCSFMFYPSSLSFSSRSLFQVLKEFWRHYLSQNLNLIHILPGFIVFRFCKINTRAVGIGFVVIRAYLYCFAIV